MANCFPHVRQIRCGLRRTVRENGGTLSAAVAESALDSGDPVAFLRDVTTYGCISGCVSGLVYFADTREFFDRHYEEIEELRREYENECGMPIRIAHDLKNDLAWFAFEAIARRLLERFDPDAF